MSNFITALLGAWCAVACFVSPVWLTMIYLELTGLIYQYDFSMDEGLAGYVGVLSLGIWILLALVPLVVFLHRVKLTGRKRFWITITGLASLILLCLILCRFDTVAFLTTPIGELYQ